MEKGKGVRRDFKGLFRVFKILIFWWLGIRIRKMVILGMVKIDFKDEYGSFR